MPKYLSIKLRLRDKYQDYGLTDLEMVASLSDQRPLRCLRASRWCVSATTARNLQHGDMNVLYAAVHTKIYTLP